MMLRWLVTAALLASAGSAVAQDLTNNTTGDGNGGEEVGPPSTGWSPIVVLAVVVGLALLIGVVVALMGRRA